MSIEYRKNRVQLCILQVFTVLLISCVSVDSFSEGEQTLRVAEEVLVRVMGQEKRDRFVLRYQATDTTDYFIVQVDNDKVEVTGSSPTAICRGVYHYLRNNTQSIVSWSGTAINIPENLQAYTDTISSPYPYRYYLNTVTHGYTMPYWDWGRWEQEIDWMAMHGMNMPLIAGAHEAILFRTFKRLGLTEEEALDYFSGPAHFPWNRMGNIGAWDGPPPVSFFQKQIDLTHKMLDRMRELQMEPIVHAFAGFVPEALKRIYPNEELRKLGWGGFKEKVHILAPKSDLYSKIGTLYIKEWEKEFGKGKYYLADSFNEMDVPLSDDPHEAAMELAGFGEAVFNPIIKANPDAVWVMQGWTFPYHKDKSGKLFWTPDRLKALMSNIPDNKLLILDMANEYNALFWKIDYSWEMYQGFFGKQWIYSFIPNMGGKVPLNGQLDFYAKAPVEAINYENKRNMVGIGFAPEGIENNELIYEMLSDWGWRRKEIDLDQWIASYARARYGSYPLALRESFDLLRKSAWGSFTDHPRFQYQFRPGSGEASVHKSEEFDFAVRAFLKNSDQLAGQPFYLYDAIELGTQWIGLKIDEYLNLAQQENSAADKNYFYIKAFDLMDQLDRLLLSHPNHRLSKWINLARKYGNTPEEKMYYESNSKRLNTTWGRGVNEYAARTWSGLIGSYYAPRWRKWWNAKQSGVDFDMLAWEEQWIKTKWKNTVEPYKNPLIELKRIMYTNTAK